jgi:hypothetical protein
MMGLLPKFLLGFSLMSVELIHMSPQVFAATGARSADLGKPVINQSELLGTWSLKGVSLEDPKNGNVSFSGSAHVRFRADGVVMAEFSKYSLSFGDHAVYGDCTGYESGLFSVASGVVTRAETMIVGLKGHCYNVKISPAVKLSQDQTLKAVIRGSTLTISSDFTVVQKGVTRHVTILSTFTRKAKDTWDGSGVDPALVGRYRLSGMYTESSCKSADMNELKGEIPTTGSWTFHATSKSYISKQEAFRIGPSEACTGTTKGQMTGGGLSIKWTQDSSSSKCMGSESSDDDQLQIKRDIVGLPSRNYVMATSMRFSNKDCDDGFSYLTLISVFARQ